MKAEKALELLRFHESNRGALFKTDLDTARLLGMEALEWLVQHRKTSPALKNVYLSSEDIK